MNFYIALFLGFVQGLTEFLPISSSGHLFIFEMFLQLDIAENPFFDVVLHAGTLIALLIYFWKEWVAVFKEAYKQKKSFSSLLKTRLGYIGMALVPLVLLGIPMKSAYPLFRDPLWVSIFFLLVGIV